MIAVKICGITSLKDAEMAVNYSVSAIGMIFCPDSPRYVDPAEVEQWMSFLLIFKTLTAACSLMFQISMP